MYILSDPPPQLGREHRVDSQQEDRQKGIMGDGGGMSKVAKQADREIRVQAEGEHCQESCAIEREREKNLQSFATLKGTNVAGGTEGERRGQTERERAGEGERGGERKPRRKGES